MLQEVIIPQLNMVSTWGIVWNWMLQVGERRLISKWMFIDKLSVLEKSSCCQPDNPHSTLLAVATHTWSCAHIWDWSPAVVCPNTRQFIIKINASFPGPSSTCHPNKTEPMEVISLLSISPTPSRSVPCRGTAAFTVVCHACRGVEIRWKAAVWWTVWWSSPDRGF